MDRYTLTLMPSSTRTRLLLTHGPDELLRAILPPGSPMYHEDAPRRLLEGLALWVDRPLRVVLSVDEKDASFCLGLTDELGVGMRSLFFTVEVVDRQAQRRRGRRIRGMGDFADLRQLELTGPKGGAL